MTRFVGNATGEELTALFPILRDITSEIPMDRLVRSDGSTADDDLIEFHSDIGQVRIVVMWKTTTVQFDPDDRTCRRLAHLRIGDAERRPSIQFSIQNESVPITEAMSHEPRCVTRLRRCAELLESFADMDPRDVDADESLLSSVAGAVGSWSIRNGMRSDEEVEVSANPDSKPTKVLWGFDFPSHGNRSARQAIDEWAASKLPSIVETTIIREKQTLCLKMDVARRRVRGDMDVVVMMRHEMRHPDMPR